VVGPSTWNSLPDSLRDPELSLDTFKLQLRTYIFCKILITKRIKCIRDLFEYVLYKSTLYLLTYLHYMSIFSVDSLKEFGTLLSSLEDERDKMVSHVVFLIISVFYA